METESSVLRGSVTNGAWHHTIESAFLNDSGFEGLLDIFASLVGEGGDGQGVSEFGEEDGFVRHLGFESADGSIVVVSGEIFDLFHAEGEFGVVIAAWFQSDAKYSGSNVGFDSSNRNSLTVSINVQSCGGFFDGGQAGIAVFPDPVKEVPRALALFELCAA